ncbi:hypothetical protein EVAR_96641_1 [Eumeta japonica]|uniref:Uncharacterized protein n=1 Tax=Eumeta variegata TaxID=151549 RepID=A0A4C1WTP6_EUMVA|nr:hypothetical protein EVAR_96641_1 [Eumeta japonica]
MTISFCISNKRVTTAELGVLRSFASQSTAGAPDDSTATYPPFRGPTRRQAAELEEAVDRLCWHIRNYYVIDSCGVSTPTTGGHLSSPPMTFPPSRETDVISITQYTFPQSGKKNRKRNVSVSFARTAFKNARREYRIPHHAILTYAVSFIVRSRQCSLYFRHIGARSLRLCVTPPSSADPLLISSDLRGQERYEKVESNATSEQRVMGRPLNRYETESDLKGGIASAKKLKVLDEDFAEEILVCSLKYERTHRDLRRMRSCNCWVNCNNAGHASWAMCKKTRTSGRLDRFAGEKSVVYFSNGRYVCKLTFPGHSKTRSPAASSVKRSRRAHDTQRGGSERGTPDVHSHRNGLRRRDWNTYGVQFPCSSAEPYAPVFTYYPHSPIHDLIAGRVRRRSQQDPLVWRRRSSPLRAPLQVALGG